MNTGIYLVEPSVMDEIPDPEEGEYDFSKDLFPKLLDQDRPLRLRHRRLLGGHRHSRAVRLGPARRARRRGARRQAPGTRLRENIYVGQRAHVDDEELEGPVVIGDNVRIDEGAEISPYTVIGNNVVISAGATVERSIIAEGTYIGEGQSS